MIERSLTSMLHFRNGDRVETEVQMVDHHPAHTIAYLVGPDRAGGHLPGSKVFFWRETVRGDFVIYREST